MKFLAYLATIFKALAGLSGDLRSRHEEKRKDAEDERLARVDAVKEMRAAKLAGDRSRWLSALTGNVRVRDSDTTHRGD